MIGKPNNKIEFTHGMDRREAFFALVYLPVHIFLLPFIAGRYLIPTAGLNEAAANLWIYCIGGVYMLVFEKKFLRRNFDPLCDRFRYVILQIIICYGIMLGCNMVLAAAVSALDVFSNPNNSAIFDMLKSDYGKISTVALFLAPIVEELIFRGAIFGVVFRVNRIAAYVVSIAAFSLYHVWAYALTDPAYWFYFIEYIPASYVLCRCYEKTDTIWASMILHFCINGIALKAMEMLQTIM